MARPNIFDTPEQLESLIDQYFKETVRPTLSGLAVYLGIDRKTLHNYKGKPEFFPIIKRARDIVEAHYEERLVYEKNQTGVIFALKNMDWSDRTEFTGTVKGTMSWEKPKYLDDSIPEYKPESE